MTLFSVAVDRASMSIDISGNTTIKLDGDNVTDPKMREIILEEIITKMAVEMVNRVPPKPEMHPNAQAVKGTTPEPLLHLMQVIASGRMGNDELSVLRETAPRFAMMLAHGLNVEMAELRRMAQRGELTSETIARAMR